VDDVGVRREEGIGFYFFEGERDGFLAEGAADLFQGEEFLTRGVLDEVDVGEAALERGEELSECDGCDLSFLCGCDWGD
jgi:hypothetical protein